jgi:enoyl-CoA hydratase
MRLSESLLVERLDAVALLTINRPAVHNALNRATVEAIGASVREASTSGAIGAVVITGAGDRAFSAGADLNELAGLDANSARDVLSAGQRIFADIEHSAVPVISAVNGLALGGGFELVLATAFPVLSTRASFALPESGLGLIPGYGGTQRLPRVVGTAVAAHVMLTGARLNAQRAYELGLSPLPPVEAQDLLATALQVARNIAARGPEAHAAILRAVRVAAPRDQDLALETALAAIATVGAEAAEGIAAFSEHRQPKFGPRGGTDS